ncbi:MAG TPA: FAD-dependent oxidoreductase [Myxococcales bacterium]|nr:FAD-dependent oxidoreductase [Myxococcales bacterium]
MPQQAKTTPSRPRQAADLDNWDIETDVAIVGFGGAGACAAIEAADAGAQVALFEVASASGGSTELSSAEVYLGGSGGTRVQKACGYEDSTEDMFNYLMAAGGDLAHEAKVRLYCEESVGHFDWLVSMGAQYKNSEYEERAIMALTDDCLLYTGSEKCWPFREIAKPCPRGHNLEVEGDNGGPLLMKTLTAQVEKRSIQVEYNARALTLIINPEGEVLGIVVRMDGKEKNVRARRGVILCAGGFVMNTEMLKQYCPRLVEGPMPIGNPGDTGAGLLMGQAVGGALINMDQHFITLPYYPPSSLTYGIFVNAQAQRFINEDCYHSRIASSALDQLGGKTYLIVSAEDYAHPPFMNAPIVGTGENVEELAEEVGLHPGMLRHTIEFYSEHAARGEDPLFHKSPEWLKAMPPPYAALDCTLGEGAIYAAFTLGGLDTRPTGEVLTTEKEVIPGLYAAGRTACGIPRSAAGYASGLSVGDATFFGRVAGSHCGQRSCGQRSPGSETR